MADRTAFRNSLVLCGLTDAAANAIISQGFSDLLTFSRMKETGIEKTIKVINAENDQLTVPIQLRFPYASQERMRVLQYWSKTEQRIGNTGNNRLEAAAFTVAEDLLEEREELVRMAKSAPEPTKPSPLRDMAKWRIFWEKWNTYLLQIRGLADIPLTYVYRETEVPTPEIRAVLYDTTDEKYIALTTLSGKHWTKDNNRVYSELKPLLIDGPAWAFIKRFDKKADGRQAVLSLIRHAEGDAALNTRKQAAYATISTARYAGAVVGGVLMISS